MFLLHSESLQYRIVGLFVNSDITLMAMTQPTTGLSNAATYKHQLNGRLINNLGWCN
jgi:hypothetical protein